MHYYADNDDDMIEAGHEVEDRNDGDTGIVTEVTRRHVIVKWDGYDVEAYADPSDLIHL